MVLLPWPCPSWARVGLVCLCLTCSYEPGQQPPRIAEAMMVIETVEYESVLVMGARSGFRLGRLLKSEGGPGGGEPKARTERCPVHDQSHLRQQTSIDACRAASSLESNGAAPTLIAMLNYNNSVCDIMYGTLLCRLLPGASRVSLSALGQSLTLYLGPLRNSRRPGRSCRSRSSKQQWQP